MRSSDPVLIVGGGLAGLTAAALVARAGLPVTVLERRAAPGGRARTHHVAGCALTEGAHAFYLGGPGARVLRGLGVDPAGRAPDLRRTHVQVDGSLERAPFGRELLTTGVLSRRERAEAAALLVRLALAPPPASPDVPAGAWLDGLSDSPRVRALVGAVARVGTYAGGYRALPASLVARQLQIGMRPGVRYVDGGWEAIVAAVRAVAERAGARVRLGATVGEVRPGVVTLADGEELRCSTVLLAGLTPAAVERLTGSDVGPVGPPVEAACLDVALSHLPNPAVPWVAGMDEAFLLSAYSEWARLAPPGGAVVQLVRHLDGPEPAAASRVLLEGVLDRAQPGWRDALVHASFLPRMTVVSAAPVPGRARPGIDATGLPGVLVAGDWVGPDGWLLDAALASAAAAASFIAHARVGEPLAVA